MTRGTYKSKPVPGSFGELIAAYRRSPRVLAWAPSTRKKFDTILGNFNAINHNFLVADLRRGDVIRMRDEMAHIPGEASNWLKVIRGLLDYAVDLEMIPFNPAARIKKLPPKHNMGFRTWREDEIAAYERYWPRGSIPRLAFTLALCTGAARGDLVRLGWANVSGDRIRYSRAKTSVVIDIPILPALAAELTQVSRGKLTFLETEDGRVRSSFGLGTHLLLWLRKAGLDGVDETGHRLSWHGLRKALGVRLAQAGCSSREIAAVLGHESPRSSEVYTKTIDRAAAADAGMEKMAGAQPTNVTRMVRKKEPGK